jgi:hypothetical protein
MNNEKLNSCLARFPTEGWAGPIDLSTLQASEMLEAICGLLEEFGRFPVPWRDGDGNRGLFVTGSDDRYIGHWQTVESADDASELASIASEDLGSAATAAKVIFGAYFAGSIGSGR